jgi:hypothetical protein
MAKPIFNKRLFEQSTLTINLPQGPLVVRLKECRRGATFVDLDIPSGVDVDLPQPRGTEPTHVSFRLPA